MKRVALSITIIAGLTISFAPPAAADPTANLKSQVDSARGSTGCPPLQRDPVLDGVAQRANRETEGYVAHTARFTPLEDPTQALRDLGYKARKTQLLAGYGDVDGDFEDKAIRGAVMQGYDVIPDCTYTKYGVAVLSNALAKYAISAVVLTDVR
jgi:hypothetical protein